MSNSPQAEGPIQGPAQLQFLLIPTNGASIKDHASNLHFAICEVFGLVFEHRELDLEESPIYALNVLTKLLADLAGIIADPNNEDDERYQQAVELLRQRFPAKPAPEA